MAILAQKLVYAQLRAHDAACVERLMLTTPAARTAGTRAYVADGYDVARAEAGAFAVFADFHPAANDEPITTGQA